MRTFTQQSNARQWLWRSTLLLLLAFLWVPLTGNAQTVVYHEDFEGTWSGTPAAPSGWTSERLDWANLAVQAVPNTDGNHDWFKATYSTGTTWAPLGSGGSGRPSAVAPTWPSYSTGASAAVFADYYLAGSGTANLYSKRIVSPQINLSSTSGTYVRFYMAWSQADAWVTVSATNDGVTYTPIATVHTPGNTTWMPVYVQVPADFRTSTARFAIEARNQWGSGSLFIDNFQAITGYTPPTVTAVASTAWNTGTTWSTGTVPTTGDNVVIPSGTTVTLNGTSSSVMYAQNLTVTGTAVQSAATTAYRLAVLGDLTVNGSLTSGTGTVHVNAGGNISGSGTINIQGSTGSIFHLTGYNQTYSFSGTVGAAAPADAYSILANSAGGTVTLSNLVKVRNTLHLNQGNIANGTNLSVGTGTGSSTVQVANGTLSNPILVGTTGTVSHSFQYGITSTGIGFGPVATREARSLNSANYFPVSNAISGLVGNDVNFVTGTFTMNTQNILAVSTRPLSIGNGTAGTATLTRGIITSTLDAPVVINTNTTGSFGSTPSTSASNTRNVGSYVAGPVRVILPSATGTTRNLPIGYGTSVLPLNPANNDPLANALRVVSIGKTSGNFPAGSDFTIQPLAAASGTGVSPISQPLGNRTFRVYQNGAADFDATTTIGLRTTNVLAPVPGGGDNLTVGDRSTTFIVQADGLNGGTTGWVQRSAALGSGAFPTNLPTLATTAPATYGSIATATGGAFFTWGTTVSPATIGTITGVTTPTNGVAYGATNAKFLRIDIPVTFGTGGFTLNSIKVTGTFTPGDLGTVRLWTDNAGDLGSQIASGSFSGDEVTLSPAYAIPMPGAGTVTRSFWVTYDILPSAAGASALAEVYAGDISITATGGAATPGTSADVLGTPRPLLAPITITPTPSNATICATGSVTLVASSALGYTYTWSPATGLNTTTGATVIASPTTTTTYTVTGNFGGDELTQQVQVTVVPPISAPLISSNQSGPFCASSTATLSAAVAGPGMAAKIGSGTGSNGSTTSTNSNPFGGWNGNKRSQVIFTAAELAASGLVAGNITAITYNLTAINSSTPTNYTNFVVRVGHTSLATFPNTTYLTGLTTVFSAASHPRPTTTGNNTITFTTPFAWNGVDNIVIETCFSNGAWVSGMNNTSAEETTVSNTVIWGGDDAVSSTICSNTSGSAVVSSRTNIRFSGLVGTAAGYDWAWTGSGAAFLSATNVPNPTFTPPSGGGSYTLNAVASQNGCASSAGTINFTVDGIVNAPTAGTASSTQCGTAVPTVSVTGTAGNMRWYDAATAGTLLQTGGLTFTTPISSNTTFYVEQVSGTCTSATRTALTVTVTTPPTFAISPASPQRCPTDAATTLTADAGFTNYRWYALPDEVTVIGTNQTLNVSPTSTTTYRAKADQGACTSEAEVTVTVNAAPSSPVIASSAGVELCQNGTSNITATTIGTGLAAKIGTGTGSTTNSHPYGANFDGRKGQVIWTAAELTASGLVAGNITAITHNITALPSSRYTTWKNFTIKIGHTSNATFSSTTYITAGMNTVLSSAAYPTPSATGEHTITFDTPFNWNGTSNIVVEYCWNNLGEWTDQGNYTVEQSSVSGVVVSNTADGNATLCATASGLNQSVRPNVRFTGQVPVTAGINWTWTGTGAAFLSATNVGNPTFTASSAGSYTLFATADNGTCQTTSSVFNINVNALPAAPTAGVASATQCGAGVPTVSVTGTASEMRWYATPTGGSPLQVGGLTYTTSVNADVTLYVERVVGACTSATRTALEVTVTPPPTLTVSPTSGAICSPGGSPVTLTALAGFTNYRWYALPDEATIISTNASYIANPGSTTTYRVRADQGACTSQADVTVSVGNTPTAPTVTSSAGNTFCAGSVSTNLTALTIGNAMSAKIGTGTSSSNSSHPYGANWDARKVQVIWTAAELSAAGLVAGNITAITHNVTVVPANRYLTWKDFTIRVAHTSNATFPSTSFITAGMSTVLSSAAYPTPSVTGDHTITFNTPFNWNGTDNIVVEYCWNNLNEWVSQGNYSVEQSSVTGLVLNSQQDGIATFCSVASGGSISSRPNVRFTGQVGTAAGFAWSWTGTGAAFLSATNVNNPTFSGAPAGSYTLVATATASGCSNNSTTLTIDVNPIPAAPTAGVASSTQCGAGVPTVSVTGTAANMRWYDVATGGTPLQEDGLTYASSIATTTTFYVEQVALGCTSATRTPLTVTVSSPPAFAVTPSSGAICNPGGSPVNLVADAGFTNYRWYALPDESTVISTNASFNANPSATTTYRVKADQGICTSQADVIVTVTDAPTTPVIASTQGLAFCGNVSTNLSASVAGPGMAAKIGAGTGSNGTTTSSNSNPFGGWNGNKRSQAIFTAAELTAAGLVAGNITAITYNITNTNSATPANFNNFVVRIGHTALTSFPNTTYLTGLTTVYSVASQPRPTTTGNNTITFSTPFVWNGVDNIVVENCFSNGGWSTGMNNTSAEESTVTNTVIWGGDDAASSTICSDASGTRVSTRTNVRFSGQVGTAAGFDWAWTGTGAAFLSATNVANPTFTPPVAGGNFTLNAVASVNGCASTAGTINLNVTGVPDAPTAVVSPVAVCGTQEKTLEVSGAPASEIRWYDVATGGTPIQATGLTFTATFSSDSTIYVERVTGACTSSTRTPIVVNFSAPPTLTVGRTPSGPLCQGVSATLEASGTGYTTYSWSIGDNAPFYTGPTGNVGITVPAVVTTYKVVASGGGCIATQEITITPNPRPTVTATATPNSVGAGDPVTLNAVVGTTNYTFGSGGTAIGAAVSAIAPFQTYWKSSRQQFLILASELSAAGVPAGDITRVSFVVSSIGGAPFAKAFTMKVFGTATTSMTGTAFVSPATATNLGPIDHPITAGVNTFNLTTPYNWNGTDNVIVEVCFNNIPEAYTFTNAISNVVTTPFASSKRAQSDFTNMCTSPGTTTNVSQRPIIILGYTPTVTYAWTSTPTGFSSSLASPTTNPLANTTYQVVVTNTASGCVSTAGTVAVEVAACPRPTTVTVGATTRSTIEVSWSSVITAANGYEVRYRNGPNVSAPIQVAGTSTTITGLNPSRTYFIQVRSICTSPDTSNWTNEVSGFTKADNDVPCFAATLPVNINACSPVMYDNTHTTTSSVAVPSCNGTASNDLWFKVTVPASGNLNVYTTLGTNVRVVATIYTGTCGSLVEDLSPNACNAAPVNGTAHARAYGLTPGSEAFIRISGFSGNLGTFGICVTQGTVWTGAVSVTTGTAGNWLNEKTPAGSDAVIVPATSTNFPSYVGAITYRELTIRDGASISNSSTLTLTHKLVGGASNANYNVLGTGTITFSTNGGTLEGRVNTQNVINVASGVTANVASGARLDLGNRLKLNSNSVFNATGTVVARSESGRTGYLARVESGATYNGNLTQQVWVPNDPTGKWWFMVPAVKGITMNSLSSQTVIGGGVPGAQFGADRPTQYFYNEASDVNNGWTRVTQLSNVITSGTDFSTAGSFNPIRAWVKHSGDLANRNTYTFTGPPIIGNGADGTNTGGSETFNFNITYTTTGFQGGGWNFVGNPYAAPVLWNNVGGNWTRTNILPTAYFWSAADMGYRTWNATTGVGTRANNIVAPGQAFFVKATASSPVLAVSEAAKSDNAATNVNRSGSNQDLVQPIRYTLTAQGTTASAVGLVGFAPDATRNFDAEYDATLMSGVINAFTVGADASRLMVNFMPVPTANESLPLNFRAATYTNLKFTFTNLDGFNDINVNAYLKDNFLGTVTQISEGMEHNFEVTSEAASSADGRFEIVYGPAAASSIENIVGGVSFSIYPNPATNNQDIVVYINNLDRSEAARITIFDATGRLVKDVDFAASAVSSYVNIKNDLAAGMYTVKCNVAGRQFSSKVVVR